MTEGDLFMIHLPSNVYGGGMSRRWMARRAWILWAASSLILVIAAPAGAVLDTSGALSGESPITKADLPSSTVALVSDTSIELANSPLLAEARAEWESDDAFVLQMDYQLEFRSKVDFMSSNPAYLAELLAERPMNMGAESMGLFMSDEEVAEMQRRDALGDKMPAIVTAVTGFDASRSSEGTTPDYGSNFGGIWQDQLDGGRIALAVVDASALDRKQLEEIVGGSEHLKIIEQDFSYHEIEVHRAQLWRELIDLEVNGDVALLWDDEGLILEVSVPDPGALVGLIGRGLDEKAYRIVEGEPVTLAGSPSFTHSLADQQPGLQILVRDSGAANEYCTWGFNGHTSTYNYIVTAGHCLQDHENHSGGALTEVDVWQNGSSSRDLTWNPYVKSVQSIYYDVARISSGYANDNCYHGNHYSSSPSPHCGWPMTNRALHNTWELGSDRTCASLGTSNTYKCGYVVAVNEGAGANKARVDFDVIIGDSGAGMKWDYRIDGILYAIVSNGTLFQTAYHATIQLGNGYFYFNCAVGKTVHSTPSSWGICPAVNA